MKISAALLASGTIILVGNIFLLAAKWPLIISIFFTLIKIYTALSLFLNHFTS
jgi:hypothetical protein